MKNKVKEIEINFEITNRCNLRCSHCIVNAGESNLEELTFGEIINFINKLKKYKLYIKFTGGEPFYRNDFYDILEYCINNDINVEIITNGLCFNEKYIKLLKNNNIKLGISIESFNENNFEKVRGANTFKKLMKNIEILIKNDIKFDIFSTITNYNISDFEGIFKKAKEWDCHIHFNDLTLDGRALLNNELSVGESNALDKILQLSKLYFGIDQMHYDDECWASNDVLFINSIGDIFFCTELNRCNKNTKIGNIRTFPIDLYYSKIISLNFKSSTCPYKVYFNDMITYVSNTYQNCKMLNQDKKINTLKELYLEFDKLLSNVTNYCEHCEYKDCMGFIWLLDSETKKYDKLGITTININDSIDFLNFASEYNLDDVDFTNMKYPKCEHRDNCSGMCKIHGIRPLVCHMYPIGLETSEMGTDMWVLHDECEFVQYLIKNNLLSDFISKCMNIIDRIDSCLYKEIVLKYKQVDDISLFLDGINSYIIIKEADYNVKM